MAKRPAIMFYPADWRSNAKLRRCSEAARGVWMDSICVLHDSDEYGVLRWPLADIAHSIGAKIKHLQELVDKGVLKGSDTHADDYWWSPTHAGKKGEPVCLVDGRTGPCWYSSRMVRDEYVRQRRGVATRFSEDNQPPNPQPNPSPKGGIGGRQGDGPSFAVSISSNPSSFNTPDNSQGEQGHRGVGSAAGHAAAALIRLGVRGATSHHPDLIAACAEGITTEALVGLHAAYPDKPAPYLIATARRLHAEGAQPVKPGVIHASPIRLSTSERVLANALNGAQGDACPTDAAQERRGYLLGAHG